MEFMRGCWVMLRPTTLRGLRRISKMLISTACRSTALEEGHECAPSAVPDGARRFPGTGSPLQFPGDSGSVALSRIRRGCREGLDRCRQRLPRCLQLGLDRRADEHLLLYLSLACRLLHRQECGATRHGHTRGTDPGGDADAQGFLHRCQDAQQLRRAWMHGAYSYACCPSHAVGAGRVSLVLTVGI